MMKKLLLGTAVISSIAFGAEKTNLYFKTGIDIHSRFDAVKESGATYNKKDNDKTGYEFSFEATREFYPNLELGLGISYQNHGEAKNSKDFSGTWYTEYKISGYNSAPLYLTGKYNFPVNSSIKPYIKADFGYSFNFDEKHYSEEDFIPQRTAKGIVYKSLGKASTKISIDDGLYYGIGAGVEYNDFIAELMYKVNTAKIKIDYEEGKEKYDFDYSRITLSIGYKFNF